MAGGRDQKRPRLKGLSSLLVMAALALVLQLCEQMPAKVGLKGLRAAAHTKVVDSAAAAKRNYAAGSAAVKEGKFGGWAHHASSHALVNLRKAVEEAAADAQRRAGPLVAATGKQIENILIKAGNQVGGLSRRFVPSASEAGEESQSTQIKPKRNFNVQVVLELPSEEVRKRLYAASAEIQNALIQYAPSLYKAEQTVITSAADKIQQIQAIASNAGRQIHIAAAEGGEGIQPILSRVSNATIGPRARVSKAGTTVFRHVEPAATRVSDGMKVMVGAAGRSFQAAIRDLQPALESASIGGTTVAEVREKIQATLVDARAKISALTKPLLAASCAEARKGVQAIAALANQYMDAAADEALEADAELLALSEEMHSSRTGDDSGSVAWYKRGPFRIVLFAAALGVAVGLAVHRRQARSSTDGTSAATAANAGSSPGRTTPKTSKVRPAASLEKGGA